MFEGRFFSTEVVGDADLDCQGLPLFVSRPLSAQADALSVTRAPAPGAPMRR
jgi:hypothetical protein